MLAYMLIETYLKVPQTTCKMPLKTTQTSTTTVPKVTG